MTITTNLSHHGHVFFVGKTFDDLRAISPAKILNGYSAIVQGGHQIGDGLGGLLVWNADSTAPDDDQTVITPHQAGVGRWIKLAVGEIGPQGKVGPTGQTGSKGDPGGNALSIGLFNTASSFTIPIGTDLVQTSGHSVVGVGQARYAYSASVNTAFVTANPRVAFISANGRGFKIAENPLQLPQLGAKADGTTDDAPALQAGIAFLGSIGGFIELPNMGSAYLWKSVPTLPPALTGTIVIRATGRPTVKLTATGKRFLDPARTADYQTFRNLSIIGGMTIDADNKSGQDHVIFGTRASNWTLGQRTNFANILIEDVDCINVPLDPTGVSAALAVCLNTAHLATKEATQNTITNIRVNRVTCDGGFSTVLISGVDLSGHHNANVYLDHIYIDGCRHLPPLVPTQFFGSSGIMVGGDGYGGKGAMSNCFVRNTGDNGYEVDALQDFAYTNCQSKNCYNLGFFVTNYRGLVNPLAQSVTYNNCGVDMSASHLGRAFGLSEHNSNPLGRILYQSCWFRDTNDTGNGYSNRFLTIGSTPASADVIIQDARIDWKFASTPTADSFPRLLDLKIAAGRRAVVRNVNTTIRGGANLANGHNWSFRFANLDGAGRILIDGVEIDAPVTLSNIRAGGISSSVGFNMAEAGAATLQVEVKNFKGSTGLKLTGVRVPITR